MQRFFEDLCELKSKMTGLHNACSFLVMVCDGDTVTKVTQEVHEIDERWQTIQRVLADQSVDQYIAGVQCISQWCEMVKTELSRHIRASYDDLSAQNNSLTVSLVCQFSPLLKIQPYRRIEMCILLRARLMSQYCFDVCRLSLSSVMLPADG